MVSGISSNVGFQGGITTATNARPYMAQPYQFTAQQPVSADTVEIAGKKKGSVAKKGIIGTLVGVAVAAAALYAGVKSGKLTEVANPSKWTEKLQNWAFKGGKGVENGVKYVTTKAKDAYEWCANKLGKNAGTVAETTIPALPAPERPQVLLLPRM